jgi:hypothetical protein
MEMPYIDRNIAPGLEKSHADDKNFLWKLASTKPRTLLL